MKVKLSAYERALNTLYRAPLLVDHAVRAAFVELVTARDEALRERDALRTELDEIAALPEVDRAPGGGVEAVRAALVAARRGE